MDTPTPMVSVDVDEKYIGIAPPDEIVSPDGQTTTITLEGESTRSSGEWFDNLAEDMDERDLADLAEKYLELIDQDVEDRKKRDEQQALAIKKSGIAEPAPGGADFEGASRVTHPVLTESYIDFAASAIKELFPPNGPVKMGVTGTPNKHKMDKAKRKAAFMNWQLTKEIPSYRPELERLLTQLPVGGSQYMKIYQLGTGKGRKTRPDTEFVPIDDIILPFTARNFFDLSRKFHRMTLSDHQYKARVRTGDYRDLSLPDSYMSSLDQTKTATITDKIEGKENSYMGDPERRLIYEGCVLDILDDDMAPEDQAVPYLITIDEESRKVLSIYRNWDEKDEECRELEYIVDFTFIPWRGVFGLSLDQCLAGLPDALTGALRALMDSALISNMPGGIKLKGNPNGQSKSVSPTEITEVDASGSDDIRKIFMALPFSQPSPMLFQLLGFLTEAAKEVVGTAEEKIADASNNMPVGTTLALIEQGAKVFSAIHARIQDSQRRCLEILHRLNRDNLPDGRIYFGTDEDDYVTREDFEGPMDVRPVSDPNIFSETQRFAQMQFVVQTLTQMAAVIPAVVQLHDLRALLARAYELAKIPDYEEFLPETPKAQNMNPVDENIALVMGKPVKAFAGQNHEAHIQVLLDFSKNPMFGASPIIASKFIAAGLNHLQDHLLVWYEETMKADAAQQMGKKVDDVNWDHDPAAILMLAKSTEVVDKASELAFGKIPAIITGAMQRLQAMQPKPPEDPMVAVAMQDIQGKHQIAQGQLSVAQQKAAGDAQAKMVVAQTKARQAEQDYHLELQRLGVDSTNDMQVAELHAKTTLAKNIHDNVSAERTAELHSKTELAKTIHDNASAQHIAAMKIKADDGKPTNMET